MIKLFFNFISNFGPNEKKKIYLIFMGCLAAGILELLGISLIYPLISVLSDPSYIKNTSFLNYLYNYVNFESPDTFAYFIGIITITVLILKNVYMMLFNYLQLTFLKNWKINISNNFVSLYLNANYEYHLKKPSPEILNSICSKISFSIDSYILSFVYIASSISTIFFILLVLLYTSFSSTLIAILSLLVLVVFQAKVIKKYSEDVGERFNISMERRWSLLSESIIGIKETKINNKQNFYLGKFMTINNENSKNQRTIQFLQIIPSYITETFLILTIALMVTTLIATANEVNIIANLALIAGAAFRLTPLLNKTLSCFAGMKLSQSSLEDLINEKAELASVQEIPPGTGLIDQKVFKSSLELDSVSYGYNSNTTCLYDINLKIKKGEFIGIVGSSGAGKTTLIDVLMGLLTPKNGHLYIDGKDLTAKGLHQLRNTIGYVHQNIFITDSSFKQNVAFATPQEDIDSQRVMHCLKKAELLDFVTSKGGIESRILENGKNLSGGQKQRLAIARALYKDPEIIVLDEATSSLDVMTEEVISKMISNLKGKKTIIAVTHRISTVKDCDKVLLLNNGKVEGFNEISILKEEHKSFQNILDLSNVKI